MRDVAHLIAVAEADDLGEVVLDDAEVIAVIGDVGRQEERIPSSDDALLAELGRPPVDFQRQLVRLDDLRRLGEALTELGEKGDVPVCEGAPVMQRRVGELLRAALGGTEHERHASRIVPLGLRPDGRDERPQRDSTRRHRREKAEHDERISPVRRTCGKRAFSARRSDFDALARGAEQDRALVPVWRDVLLDTDTPVSAFAKLRRGTVRLPARVRAGRRRDLVALHLPRHRAAGSVAAARRRGRRLAARDAAGTARADRPIRSPIWARGCEQYEPVDVPELGAFWSGAVGYLRLRRRAAHRATAASAAARSRRARRAVRASRDAVVIIDNLRARRRASWSACRWTPR